MQCSGLQVAAFVLLLCGTILIDISIGTSHWSKKTYAKGGLASLIGGSITAERGLWQECTIVQGDLGESFRSEHERCVNRYEEAIKKAQQLQDGTEIPGVFQNLEPWDYSVLAMMCSSGLLGILALLFSPCCCNRCGCCLASFIFLAASLCASGIATYAYYVSTSKHENSSFIEDINLKHFGWSFWCAVGGGACQFFSGIMFAVSRCRQHTYSHTI